MKRTKFLVVVALALAICLPGMAGAVTTFGDPISTGSWSQRFQEDSVGNFNAIEAFMVEPAGTDFESPGWSVFSNPGWTSSTPNLKYAVATGPATTWMQMNLTFTGTADTPLKFDFFALMDGTIKDSARATWNGAWSFAALPSGVQYNHVPLPPSVLLLGTGILGLVGLGWRRSRKES